MMRLRNVWGAPFAGLLLMSCAQEVAKAPESTLDVGTTAPSFEAWRETVRFGEFEHLYTVNERAILGDEELKAYYDAHIVARSGLALDTDVPDVPTTSPEGEPGTIVPFARDTYSESERQNFSYCINRLGLATPMSTEPHTYYDAVVEAFDRATVDWGILLDTRFQHVEWMDGKCCDPDPERRREAGCVDERGNPRPVEDVRWYVHHVPRNPSGENPAVFVLPPRHNRAGIVNYRGETIHTRVFYLHEDFITESSERDGVFTRAFDLTGFVRHAVGRALGFIAEQRRFGDDPDRCIGEPRPYRALTEPDIWSVMAFPADWATISRADAPCVGQRPNGFAFSILDVMGTLCAYRTQDRWYYCDPAVQDRVLSEAVRMVDPGAESNTFRYMAARATAERAFAASMAMP